MHVISLFHSYNNPPLAKGSRICQLITTTVFSELGTEDDAGYLGDSGITVGR